MRKVADQRGQALGIVVDHPERNVAVRAEQSSNALAADALSVPVWAPSVATTGAAAVVVVDDEARSVGTARACRDLTARRAAAALRSDHAPEVGEPDSAARL